MKATVELLWESVRSSLRHRVPRMGAALAFYAAFSLAPIFVLLLSLLSLFIQRDEASQRIVSEISGMVGVEGSSAIQSILANAQNARELSWRTFVSVLLLTVTASGMFGELQDSLNTIYEVPPQKSPWFSLIKDRFLSVVMVFIIGFFMVVSLLASAVVNELAAHWESTVARIGSDISNSICLFAIVASLFATIYKVLPDVEVKWRNVIPGALVGATLFVLGKWILAWYVIVAGFSSHFGPAASFMVILFWVFYSAQILYFGAEYISAISRKAKRSLSESRQR